MKERDYILATTLAHLRDAQEILCRVVPGNVASALGLREDRARDEIVHARRCIDVYIARLEWKMEQLSDGADANDDEPWLRDWPMGCDPTAEQPVPE